MKISVIIPIYNSEDFLEKCIYSVINQTYKDLEVICINDGSKDSSELIIKKIQQEDKRVKLYNQLNSGVSMARNKGIELSTGDKILFLDSDDFFKNKKIIEKYLKFREFDLIISSYSHIIKTNEIEYKASDFEAKNKKEIEKYLLQKKNILFYATVLGKVFNAKIIKKNNIKFEKISYGEDTDFMFKYIYHCQNLKVTEDILYTYYLSENSLSRGIVKDSWQSFLVYYKSFNSIFENKNQEAKTFIFYRGVKATLLLETKNKNNYKDIFLLIEKIREFISREKINEKYCKVGVYDQIIIFLLKNNSYLLYLLMKTRNKFKI